MILTPTQTILTILAVAVATVITRFLPFLLMARRDHSHPLVAYLGRTLPYAAVGFLVVYCLKDVSLAVAPHGIPEAVAILVIAGLHWWRNNTLLSIGVGTAVYMLLVSF